MNYVLEFIQAVWNGIGISLLLIALIFGINISIGLPQRYIYRKPEIIDGQLFYKGKKVGIFYEGVYGVYPDNNFFLKLLNIHIIYTLDEVK